MATYRELVGKKIKKVTSDPSTGIDGQMWYNSTTGNLKGLAIVSAWSSAASMITARGYGSANGTQTASLYTGGLEPGGTYYANTEEYNGSGWSAGGALPATNYAAGSAGTQTAALFFGGGNASGQVGTTYTYNGSSWTASPNSLNLTRDYICGTGTQTSALAYCGRVTSPSLAVVANFEEWNGSSWTALTAAPTAVALSMGEGPETASFFASGGTNNGGPPYVSTAQEYNGSTLSTGGSVNTGRAAGGAAGNSSAGLIFGGDVGGSTQTKTETYDGTSFSEIADMSTAMRGVGNGSGATNAAALAASSYGPPALGTTEEFTSSTNVITAAAWSSGGSMGTARVLGGSACSSQTSGIVFGGSTPYTTNTESYDGTSWTELNNMVLGRSYIAGFGTATAAVGAGGYLTSPSPGSPGNMKSEVEEWDGSSWSEQTNLPGARLSAGSCGTQTAGLLFGGATSQPFNPTIQTGTFEYDGSSWTAGGALPEAKAQGNSGGIQTAAFFANGRTVPGSRSAKTAFYNGTAWSEGADVVTVSPGTGNTGATGTTSAGQATSDANLTNNYDGTAWATAPNYSTARGRSQGGGTQTSNIFAGGYSPSSPNYRSDTEEFTGETETANVKTFSTS